MSMVKDVQNINVAFIQELKRTIEPKKECVKNKKVSTKLYNDFLNEHSKSNINIYVLTVLLLTHTFGFIVNSSEQFLLGDLIVFLIILFILIGIAVFELMNSKNNTNLITKIAIITLIHLVFVLDIIYTIETTYTSTIIKNPEIRVHRFFWFNFIIASATVYHLILDLNNFSIILNIFVGFLNTVLLVYINSKSASNQMLESITIVFFTLIQFLSDLKLKLKIKKVCAKYFYADLHNKFLKEGVNSVNIGHCIINENLNIKYANNNFIKNYQILINDFSNLDTNINNNNYDNLENFIEEMFNNNENSLKRMLSLLKNSPKLDADLLIKKGDSSDLDVMADTLKDELVKYFNNCKDLNENLDFNYIYLNKFKILKDNFKRITKTFSKFNKQSYDTYDVYIRKNPFHQEGDDDLYDVVFMNIINCPKIEKMKIDKNYKMLLLAKISHEFKYPLMLIQSHSESLQENEDMSHCDKKETYSYLKYLAEVLMLSILDLSQYVNEKRDYGNVSYSNSLIRIYTLNEYLFNLGKILLIIYNKPKLSILINLDPSIQDTQFTSNEKKLKQVLFNLLTNAIKNTLEGEIKINISKNVERRQQRSSTLKNNARGFLNIINSEEISTPKIRKESNAYCFTNYLQSKFCIKSTENIKNTTENKHNKGYISNSNPNLPTIDMGFSEDYNKKTNINWNNQKQKEINSQNYEKENFEQKNDNDNINSLIITIEDSGCGLRKSMLEMVNTEDSKLNDLNKKDIDNKRMAYTTNTGLGIGLIICKKLCADLNIGINAQIIKEDRVIKGTCFKLSFKDKVRRNSTLSIATEHDKGNFSYTINQSKKNLLSYENRDNETFTPKTNKNTLTENSPSLKQRLNSNLLTSIKHENNSRLNINYQYKPNFNCSFIQNLETNEASFVNPRPSYDNSRFLNIFSSNDISNINYLPTKNSYDSVDIQGRNICLNNNIIINNNNNKHSNNSNFESELSTSKLPHILYKDKSGIDKFKRRPSTLKENNKTIVHKLEVIQEFKRKEKPIRTLQFNSKKIDNKLSLIFNEKEIPSKKMGQKTKMNNILNKEKFNRIDSKTSESEEYYCKDEIELNNSLASDQSIDQDYNINSENQQDIKLKDSKIEDSTKYEYKFYVVDDNKNNQSAIERLINRYFQKNSKSYLIKCLDDGIELINEVYLDIQRGNNCSKMIFSDQMMEFMNGSEAFKIIKNLLENKQMKPIPFIICSAFNDEGHYLKMKNLGIEHVFEKPISFGNIEHILDNYLSEY